MDPSEDMAAAVRAEIEKVRAQYLSGMPATVDDLLVLSGRLVGTASDRATLEDLRDRLHRLAGSGGTFGLAALGEHARRLERDIDRWLADGCRPTAGEREVLCDGIAALKNLLAEDTAAPANEPVAAPAPPAVDRAMRVWLAGTDAAAGEELARLLAPFGYEVRLFATFTAVTTAAREGEAPDVVIADVGRGGQALAAVDAQWRGSLLGERNCPLLIVAEQRDFASCAQAARLGAVGFLEKPLEASRLVDRLERIGGLAPPLPYRVLIVDDDVSLAEHYRLVLTLAGMEVATESSPERAVERVETFRPELLLLDVHMPGCTGPELATVIRYRDELLSLPIVYLSAETDLDRQIEALGRGADDFLTKPISDVHLVASVRARAARSRQLADLMSKDSLTGLLKHARIKEEIEAELARAQRSGKPVSVAMLDIDHFKSVNDTYGHAVGDRVIRAIAQLLRQRLRKSDLIGRYGGEEFVVVLPQCDAAMARLVLEDIRERFAALSFRHGEREFACTVSAGIASATGGIAGSELLVVADEALYEAKHGGRNRTCLGALP